MSSLGENCLTYRSTARSVSGWVTAVVSSAEAHVSLGLTATTLSRTSGSSWRWPSASVIACSICSCCVRTTGVISAYPSFLLMLAPINRRSRYSGSITNLAEKVFHLQNSVSLAMPHRLFRLPSQSPSLESRTLLLSRLVSSWLDEGRRWSHLIAESLEKSAEPEYDCSSIEHHPIESKPEESVREDAHPCN